MSLCMICSSCLPCDGDILCKKHHAEFLKVEAAIRSDTKEPPFGLLKAAFDEQTFARIGIIYWGNSKALSAPSPEEVGRQIQQIVDERNAETHRQASVRDDPKKYRKSENLLIL